MVYELSRLICRLVFFFYFRWEVYGRENILGAKGGIIAVNHTSFLDPTLVGTPIPGEIYYMAKKELFENRLVGWYFRKLNAIPLDRDKPSITMLKKLINLVKEGNLVLMFPEGTRSTDGSLGKGRGGVGMLAAKSRATIYPCYIMGAGDALPKGGGFFRPRKIRITFGRPTRYDKLYDSTPSKQAYEEISGSIMDEIAKLKKNMQDMLVPVKVCNSRSR